MISKKLSFISLVLSLAIAVIVIGMPKPSLAFSFGAESDKERESQQKLKNLMHSASRENLADWQRRSKSWNRVDINTTSGPIFGYGDENITSFLGVPFAATTAGNNRWAPPKPHAGWTEPRNCTWWGPACPQPKSDFYWSLLGQSEECLSLNIYMKSSAVPSPPSSSSSSSSSQNNEQKNEQKNEPKPKKKKELLPIMFWLFGGCWNFGDSQWFYRGWSDMVHRNDGKDVIYVTINYRVMMFGGLGGYALKDASPDGSVGNWNIQDQRAALEWVSKNAEAFGGDPSRITVFGESAGAGSTSIFLTSPSTWHLFSRAIVESGPVSDWTVTSLDKSNKTYTDLCIRAGCPASGPDSVSCMRAKPWQWFVDNDHGSSISSSASSSSKSEESAYHAKSFIVTCTWAPTLDGVAIKEDPHVARDNGRIAPVPVILGTNHDEGSLFNYNSRKMSDADYIDALSKYFGPNLTQKIHRLYPPADYGGSPWQALTAVGGERMMFCPNRDFARKMQTFQNTTRNGAQQYVYLYSHHNLLLKIFAPWLGVPHMAELVNVWNMAYLQWGPGEKRLSEMFIDMWRTFAHYGTPNTKVSGNSYKYSFWAPFTLDDSGHGVDSSFVINTNKTGPYGVNEVDVRRKKCEFWREYSP